MRKPEEIAGRAKAERAQIEALLERAEDNALFRARPLDAVRFAQSALREAERTRDEYARARSRIPIGNYAIDTCDYATAISVCTIAYETLQQTTDVQRRLTAARIIGIAQSLLERYEQALETFYRALREANRYPDTTYVGLLYHDLANLHLSRGENGAARLYSLEAIRTLEERDARILPFAYYNAAITSRALEDTLLADQFLQTARTRLQKDIDTDINELGIGVSPFDLKLLGDIYKLEGRPDEAKRYHTEACSLLKDFRFSFSMVECQIELAKAALKISSTLEAHSYLDEGMTMARRIGHQGLIARVELICSDYYRQIGQHAPAEQSLHRVLGTALHRNHVPLASTAAERLGRLHEAQKNYASAARYYRQANELHRPRVVSPLPGLLAVPTHRADRETLSFDLQHLQREYVNKCKEVDSLKANLLEKEAALLTLRQKLSGLVQQSGSLSEAQRGSVREVVRLIEKHQVRSTKQISLQNSLSSLNRDFTKRLRELTTGLTASETEVAGLIALGFDNADIQEILQLSSRTIENHRFRIRRKLQLPRSEKLEIVLKRLHEN